MQIRSQLTSGATTFEPSTLNKWLTTGTWKTDRRACLQSAPFPSHFQIIHIIYVFMNPLSDYTIILLFQHSACAGCNHWNYRCRVNSADRSLCDVSACVWWHPSLMNAARLWRVKRNPSAARNPARLPNNHGSKHRLPDCVIRPFCSTHNTGSRRGRGETSDFSFAGPLCISPPVNSFFTAFVFSNWAPYCAVVWLPVRFTRRTSSTN